MDAIAGFGVFGVLFMVFVGFLWVLMPFAVFGTKDLIRKQVEEQKKTNELLEKILNKSESPN